MAQFRFTREQDTPSGRKCYRAEKIPDDGRRHRPGMMTGEEMMRPQPLPRGIWPRGVEKSKGS